MVTKYTDKVFRNLVTKNLWCGECVQDFLKHEPQQEQNVKEIIDAADEFDEFYCAACKERVGLNQ